MGKNKRKRKLKEQDFKKVKLKVGKRLQPAENATNTSFKSRTIFVPTQLSEVDGPTNQRKQTIKDLLTKVGHYSATTRQEAFLGLRDLFKLHTDLMHENLAMIIKPLAEKMTDNDASVRQSLLLLLSYIFPSISQEKMAPFCPLILAHLSCAMTHIYDDIQHDSLGFLELCLQCFPECMVISSSQLIQNFIGMISHRCRVSNAKDSHRLAGKGLSVNPNGKLSSSKSRLKVLQHLLAFLKALESSASFNKGTSNHLFCSVSNRLKKKTPIFKFLQQEPTTAQILQHSVQESTALSFTLDGGSPLLCSNNNHDNKSNILSDSQQIRELMETVFPLLLECWIECNPAQLTTGLPDSVMFSSTINLMLAITDILKVLFKAAQITGANRLSCFNDNSSAKWLADLYLKDFKQQFMVYFPFVASCSVPLKKVKGKLGKSSRQSLEGKDAASVLALNFGICEIMVNFLTNLDNSARKGCHISVGKLKEFVVHSLELKANGGVKAKLLQAEHVERLVQFVNQLVLFYCKGKQDSEMVKELLDATYYLYQASRHMSGSKNTLVQFFASLVFSENHLISRHKEVCMLASEWLPSLPSLLVKLKHSSPEMTEVVLIVLIKAVMQGVFRPDADFLSHLSMFFSKNSGSFVNLTESLQRRAIELLFQLPLLSDQFLHSLVECCQIAPLQGSVIQYVLQILHYRSPCYQGFLSHSAAFALSTYLRFLFSVAIGYTRKQLDEYQLETNLGVHFHKYTLPGQCHFVILEENQRDEGVNRPDDAQFVLWEGHKATLQAVCQNYKQCNQSNDLLRHMGVALSTFLDDFEVLPVSAVYSVLTIVNCLVELASAGPKDDSASTSRNLSNELLSKLAELSVVCLSWSTDTNSSTVLRHARTEKPPTAGPMTVKLDLFDTAVEMLCTVPLMTSKVLWVLLRIVTDEDSDDAMKATFVKVMTRLLQSEVKTILFQSTDVVQQIVSRILSSASRCSGLSQCSADLQYQHFLFKVEAGQM